MPRRDERGVTRMAKEEKEVTRLSASTPHMSMFANNALLGGGVRVRGLD